MKKFEFTGETKTLANGATLHRIKALVRIGNVEAGTEGGWIEKEGNLSHDGNAWVHGDARVFGDAEVFGNARVSDNAIVFGDARVFGNAEVFVNAEVFGDARVSDNAIVFGDARVFGNAEVFGDAEVAGNAEVFGNAEVYNTTHYMVVGPIGSRNEFTTFFRTKNFEIKVACGCFLGNIDEFLKKVEHTHGDSKHALVYKAAAELARLQIDLNPEEN